MKKNRSKSHHCVLDQLYCLRLIVHELYVRNTLRVARTVHVLVTIFALLIYVRTYVDCFTQST